jgi:tetratricopeptide (TPR) repeat protein
VLETQAEHETARGRLERVYENLGRWDALVESLRQRLERAEDAATREAILLRIADLQDLKQDNPDAAIDTLESLLAEQPGLSGAIQALEQLVEAREEQRVRLFAILRPLYEQAQDAMRLVAVDEWQLTQTEDPVSAPRAAAGDRQRCSSRRAPRAPSTRSTRSCARSSEPGPEDALEALDVEIARLSRQYGFDADLREAQLQAAESERLQPDAGRRVSLMLQAAQLAVNVGDNDAAIKILRHALEVGPDDRNALALLDEALTLAADFEGLRAILERRVEVADRRRGAHRPAASPGPPGRGGPRPARRRRGRVARILDIEPTNTDAMLRLRRLYAAKGDHARCSACSAVRSRSPTTPTPARRCARSSRGSTARAPAIATPRSRRCAPC